MATLEQEAKKLVDSLETERAGKSAMLYKVVKTLPTTQTILTAPPELQIAVIQFVVATYARMGNAKKNGMKEWFRDDKVPSAGAEIVRLLVRKQLPFTDDILAELFEQLAAMSFLSLVEFNEQLVSVVVRRAAGAKMSPELRKAIKQFADVLTYQHVPKARAEWWQEEWGMPRACDRKLATKISSLLETT